MTQIKVHVRYSVVVNLPDGMLDNYSKHSDEVRDLCDSAVRDSMGREKPGWVWGWAEVLKEDLECH